VEEKKPGRIRERKKMEHAVKKVPFNLEQSAWQNKIQQETMTVWLLLSLRNPAASRGLDPTGSGSPAPVTAWAGPLSLAAAQNFLYPLLSQFNSPK